MSEIARLLAAALAYAAAGIHVFPVRVAITAGGAKKVGPIARWREASTTSADTIRGWWASGSEWADASIAIDCGRSGLVVVDPDGEDGLTAWGKLVAEHDLPATWRAATPGGGEHWYYAENPRRVVGIDSSGKVAEHVDVRGLGGFVIAPPSTDSRGAYRWLEGAPSWPELPTVPALVADRMNPRDDQREQPGSAAEPRSGAPGGDGDPFDDSERRFTREQAEAFIRPHFDALRSAPVGTINSRLNDAAVVLGHFVPAFWSRTDAERWLTKALGHTGYDSATWKAAPTIASGLNAPGWRAVLVEHSEGDAPPARSRRTDLTPYLDGTYRPPEPTAGGDRDDAKRMLYPARWHTLIAPTTSGKTWCMIGHARDALLRGETVVYLHFEELEPAGTIERLRALSVPADVIRKQFIWLSCERGWVPGELATELEDLQPSLMLLDGINAACSRHDWDVEKTQAVGKYRDRFVTPAVAVGAAVLSAGHPPKARDRKDERHGFGSTAWLDEVDGVGFRLVPGKSPIRRGATGSSAIYSVKDRYGGVERTGIADGQSEGWVYLGSLVVEDDSERTRLRFSAPDRGVIAQKSSGGDAIDVLADMITDLLTERDGRRFTGRRQLIDDLRARKIQFADSDVEPALIRMSESGRLARDPDPGRGRPRGGWLTEEQDHDDPLEG